VIVSLQEDYRWLFASLLPEGPIWPREADSDLGRLLGGLAAEFARVHGRALQLIEEIDPRTTYELLIRWESVAGLPDPCAGDVQSLAGRRKRLLSTITARGGARPAYFTALAADLGFYIEIDECLPASVDRDCNWQLWADTAAYCWRVRAPLTSVEYADCTSGCDEPLRLWGNAPLECAIERRKPAHTFVYFGYIDINDGGPITDPPEAVLRGGPIIEPYDRVLDFGAIA